MDLDNLRTFLAVVDHGGVLAAARALELPKQTVSRRLAALETEVGVALIERAHRPISFTQAGELFAARCRRVLDEVDAALRETRAQSLEPRGQLRIAAPQLFARKFLGAAIAELLTRHEDLRVKLVASDDLDPSLPWTFDAVFWIGEPPDVQWRARRLGVATNELCAAPSLLARYGAPRRPRDLASLPGLDYHRQPRRRPWLLTREGTQIEVALEPRVETNEPEVALEAALAGLGVASLPSLLVRPHLDAGVLVRVLPSWRVHVGPISLLYRAHAHPPARLEAFMTLMDGRLDPIR